MIDLTRNNQISYYGFFLTQDAIEKTKEQLRKEMNTQEFNAAMKEMKMIKDMHVTLAYFGHRDNPDRNIIPSNQILGNQAALKVTGIGIYVKDGKLMNIGLEIDRNSVKEAMEELGVEGEAPMVSHVTIAINAGKDSRGRPIAFAKDTNQCDFKHYPEDQQFEIDTQLGVFMQGPERGSGTVLTQIEGNDIEQLLIQTQNESQQEEEIEDR